MAKKMTKCDIKGGVRASDEILNFENYNTATLCFSLEYIHNPSYPKCLLFREVLASPSVLNLPDRTNWKDCQVDKEEEIALTKAFRKRFTPYDFNFT